MVRDLVSTPLAGGVIVLAGDKGSDFARSGSSLLNPHVEALVVPMGEGGLFIT